jgi:hypothetical protein
VSSAIAQPAAPPAQKEATPPPAEGADTAKRDEARQRFLKGLEHVEAGNWDAALAEFLASRDLFPTQVAIKNAAIALGQLKRNAEALDMYEELVRRFGDKLSPADKAATDKSIAQLRTLVGEIEIDSNQAGASVLVDGQQRGATPLAQALRVDAGTRNLRVQKEGFLPFEAQVRVAGGQKKSVKVALSALAESGRLSVSEDQGRSLEVVIDGAVVGNSPWSGVLSVGTHSVVLRGPNDLGTAPTAAAVRANQTTTLRLKAVVLDASLRVEPTPANARLFIDGVEVGNGIWEGRLASGNHRVEIVAPGFLSTRRDVRLSSGQKEVERVALERDLENPMWKSFRPHIYVEALAGLALARSFAGSADEACGGGDCSDRSRPFGFLAGARGGYQLTPALGVELTLGYLRLKEKVTRTKTAQADVPTRSTDYHDQTTVSGPFAAVSASYQFLEKTPITARVWAGAMRGRAAFENRGKFSGTVTQAGTGETFAFSESVSIPEESKNIWIPFVGPEIRVGYRVSPRFMFDGGIAALFFFGPATRRTGSRGLDPDLERRSAQLPDYPNAFSNGEAARPGVMKLDPDDGFGTFLLLVPSLGARLDF